MERVLEEPASRPGKAQNLGTTRFQQDGQQYGAVDSSGQLRFFFCKLKQARILDEIYYNSLA